MSIFSLNWFKSRKQREFEELKIEEQALKNALLRQQFIDASEKKQDVVVTEPVLTKPFRNVKLVNDVLTVVLNDGNVLSKPNATQEDFNDVRAARYEEEVLNIMSVQEVVAERKKQEAEAERMRAIQKGIQELAKLDDFEVKDNTVYLKGINRSLPQLLVEEFLRIVDRNQGNSYLLANDEEFQSLKRFFMWCCLNPRAEVAHELYRFLKENSFRITKQGFFVALRNVVTLHGSPELVHFISNAYNKVKAVWKKSPDNYDVYLKDGSYYLINHEDTYVTRTVECEACNEDGEIFDEEYEEWLFCDMCNGEGEYTETVKKDGLGEYIGKLTELYLDLPNRAENRFTDDWTKTFDIRIGRPVNMPMSDCNWSTQDCAAAGLHFTSDQIHYVGCGDQSVLVLINPMKVVGIGQHKGRCYEYLPIMTVPRDEATSILHDLDFDTLQLDDSYALRELAELTEKAKDGFVAESKKYQFNIPHISTTDIFNIVSSLEEIRQEISGRVKLILD